MLPCWASWIASVLFLIAYALYAEVLRENTWLSRTIEVQKEQKVIDTGLYGIVRVIEAGGVGYSLFCSLNTLQNAMPVGEMMRVYTYLNVTQDGVTLFGFGTKEERNMFLRLTTVSGIGPKTAIGILGSMSMRDLTLAIVMGDTGK